MIIFDDADINQALNGAAFATFVASGQTCIMGARILVHKSIYENFVSMMTEKVRVLFVFFPSICFTSTHCITNL